MLTLAVGLAGVLVANCGPGVLGGGVDDDPARAASAGTGTGQSVDDAGVDDADDAGDAEPDAKCDKPPENTSGTVTICATSRGSAKAGPYERGGRTLMTTPAAVRNADRYAKQYDGDVVFEAAYSITFKADGSLDTANSSVTFTASKFTASGSEEPTTFKTHPIPITGVTLSSDCPPEVEGFSFEGDDWYVGYENKLKDEHLSGSINLKSGAASFEASYAWKHNGAILTYSVSGTISESGKCGGTPTPDAGTSDSGGDAGAGTGTGTASPNPVPLDAGSGDDGGSSNDLFQP